jgi:hypothetical protein
MRALMLIALGLVVPITVAAAGKTYKWVDANGTVQYSETLPAQGAAHVEVVPAPPAPSAAGAKEACVSHECYAKQLERERIEREKGYARTQAEQERHERQVRARKAGEAAVAKQAADDDALYKQCVRGDMGFVNLRDCDDPKKLRAAGKRLQATQERQSKHVK